MKIDRLMGIITTLQQQKKVTAPYLAAKFEVSRRTISRDIDDICKAGIPLVTTQGGGGGISIMEGFQLDTTVLTAEELQSVFIGLKSLDSVSNTSYSTKLARKLGGDAAPLADCIRIDLSSYYKDSLAAKIEQLKEAMDGHKLVRFHYYYSKGEEDRRVEPYRIVFKWSSWYLFGFCTGRQDFRLFKLNRLWELCVLDTAFAPREIPGEKARLGSHITDDYFVTALYDPDVKYRLVEERGPGSFTVQEDGRLYTRWGFSDPESTVLWFLGFGDKVEVVEPREMRDRIRTMAEKIRDRHTGT